MSPSSKRPSSKGLWFLRKGPPGRSAWVSPCPSSWVMLAGIYPGKPVSSSSKLLRPSETSPESHITGNPEDLSIHFQPSCGGSQGFKFQIKVPWLCKKEMLTEKRDSEGRSMLSLALDSPSDMKTLLLWGNRQVFLPLPFLPLWFCSEGACEKKDIYWINSIHIKETTISYFLLYFFTFFFSPNLVYMKLMRMNQIFS